MSAQGELGRAKEMKPLVMVTMLKSWMDLCSNGIQFEHKSIQDFTTAFS
jgi:hypothetical protein